MFGPIIGALVVTTMEYYLAPFGAWVTIIQGMIFVVCVMSFREGIIGIIGSLKTAFRRSSRSATISTRELLRLKPKLDQ